MTARLIAMFLLLLSLVCTLGSAMGVAIMADIGFYTHPVTDAINDSFDSITRTYCYQILDSYRYESDPSWAIQYTENTNFQFELIGQDNTVIQSTHSSDNYQCLVTLYYDQDEEYNDVYSDYWYEEDRSPILTIRGYVTSDLVYYDQYKITSDWIYFLYNLRYTLIITAIVGFILTLFLLVFLLTSAGHGKDGEIHLNAFDRIPFDILIAAIFLLACFEASFGYWDSSFFVIVIIFAIVDIIIFIFTIMTLSVRIKTNTLFRNTLIYRLLRLLTRGFRKCGRLLTNIFTHISLYWKALIGMLGLSIIELIFMVGFNWTDDLLPFWFIEKILLTLLMLIIVFHMRYLQRGGQKLAAGDLDYQIDTHTMHGDFKEHGENLNSIRLGMQNAVNKQLQSERFKTELITNVSHDIKTPLTSIINYVDLIKKEEISNDTLKDYINVLDRQSARLKKLIEDLVEASKASTGNLTVNLEPCEVGILLSQAAAEYDEKLQAAGLELIMSIPQSPVTIMADGRHLWRVFDNLLNNICKYAQPHTRVYLDLEVLSRQAVITFRNISSQQLNIPSSDLLERFVRGDSSRNTEGSGLGLSIANSLTELQNGHMNLVIDGDLFKVVLSFNSIESPES